MKTPRTPYGEHRRSRTPPAATAEHARPDTRRARTRERHRNRATPSAISRPTVRQRIITWIYVRFYSSAHKRRRSHQLLVSFFLLCAGLGVLITAGLLHASHRSTHVVALNRTLYQGTVISEDDLSYTAINSGIDTQTLVSDAHSIVGKMSPVTLSKGSVIPKTLITDVPILPRGYACIDIRVASSLSTIRVGDNIALISSEESISDDAIVMNIPETPKSSNVLWQDTDAQSALVTIALPAEDAVRVLSAQSTVPIIAVPSSKDPQ